MGRPMICPYCGYQLTEWSEPSFVREIPNWWPKGYPYNPPVSESHHKLCLACGWRQVEVDKAEVPE